jgi:hypothetical protein
MSESSLAISEADPSSSGDDSRRSSAATDEDEPRLGIVTNFVHMPKGEITFVSGAGGSHYTAPTRVPKGIPEEEELAA